MYINIIRAGEEGGILHELLPDLTEFLQTSAQTRQAIISAMIYPIVLLATGIISVFLLLVFVVPQFAAMFEDEELEKSEIDSTVNGMLDSLLFGLGFGGAVISTVKNVLMVVANESEKKSPDYEEAVFEFKYPIRYRFKFIFLKLISSYNLQCICEFINFLIIFVKF